MKKLRKIITMVALLSIFALSTAAFAQSYNYDTTLPTFGHKTVTEGVKYNDEKFAVNTTGYCQSAFICWLDYKDGNTWRNCSDDYEFCANESKTILYKNATPNYDTGVRLRTKCYPQNVLGGQRITGGIVF